jgi:hypothetical protein
MTTLGRCLSSCSVLTESCSATNCVSTNVPSDSWWARSPSRAAEFFHVSWRTAAKWAHRYREAGPAGMRDRSSARLTQHAKTPTRVVREIRHLRWKQRLGPVPIAAKLNVPASTVHAVLVRCQLNRLSHIDRVAGEPARPYERERPGGADPRRRQEPRQHPNGGGLRYLGKQQGNWNRQAARERTGASNPYHQPKVGTCFVATVIDDYSRVAYSECHDDATPATAAVVLYRSENARRDALAGWLHQYIHHRPHSALGGLPPITRLNNMAGHHIERRLRGLSAPTRFHVVRGRATSEAALDSKRLGGSMCRRLSH